MMSTNAPGPECQNRGTVFGAARGANWTRADEHARRALDDARNKAAELGANYLQATPPQFTQSPQMGPTGATVMATAFSCVAPTPPDAASPLQTPAPSSP